MLLKSIFSQHQLGWTILEWAVNPLWSINQLLRKCFLPKLKHVFWKHGLTSIKFQDGFAVWTRACNTSDDATLNLCGHMLVYAIRTKWVNAALNFEHLIIFSPLTTNHTVAPTWWWWWRSTFCHLGSDCGSHKCFLNLQLFSKSSECCWRFFLCHSQKNLCKYFFPKRTYFIFLPRLLASPIITMGSCKIWDVTKRSWKLFGFSGTLFNGRISTLTWLWTIKYI